MAERTTSIPIEAIVDEAYWMNNKAATLLCESYVSTTTMQAFKLYQQSISEILRVLELSGVECVDYISKVISIDPDFQSNLPLNRVNSADKALTAPHPITREGQTMRGACLVGLQILHNMTLICFECGHHSQAYSIISGALRLLSVYDAAFPKSQNNMNGEIAIIYISLYLTRCQIVHDWKPSLRNMHEDFIGLTKRDILDDTMVYLIEALKCSKDDDGFIREGCHMNVADVLQMMGRVLQSHGYARDALVLFRETACLREHFSREEYRMGSCVSTDASRTSGAPAA